MVMLRLTGRFRNRNKNHGLVGYLISKSQSQVKINPVKASIARIASCLWCFRCSGLFNPFPFGDLPIISRQIFCVRFPSVAWRLIFGVCDATIRRIGRLNMKYAAQSRSSDKTVCGLRRKVKDKKITYER